MICVCVCIYIYIPQHVSEVSEAPSVAWGQQTGAPSAPSTSAAPVSLSFLTLQHRSAVADRHVNMNLVLRVYIYIYIYIYIYLYI